VPLNKIKILLAWVCCFYAVSVAQALDDRPPLIIDEPAPVPEQAKPPPDIKPYEIPTMRGNKRDFHHTPPIKLAPVIDADAVFKMIVNCFPERPDWGLEV